MPRFPGMVFLRNLTMLAYDMKKFPSEIYQQYLRNKNDIILLLAYNEYEVERQKKEQQQMESRMPRIPGGATQP